jgi:hypothetical protein
LISWQGIDETKDSEDGIDFFFLVKLAEGNEF